MTVAIERMPCPPTPESMMSRFMVVLLFFCVVAFGGLDALAARDDDRNPFVFDLFADRAADLLHVGRGTTTRMCSGSTPSPAQICSRRPVPAESWPPVMPVVRLSEITTVMLLFSFTASSRAVMPEWVKVESPITATEGNCPPSAAPLAIVTEAPISTQVSIARNGGSEPSV